MNLNIDCWHVRLFFWSLGIWDEFRENNTAYLYNDGTSICHFVRVICVYMPLVLLLHLALLVFAILTVIAQPIYLFGWIGYGYILAGVAAIIITPFCVKVVLRKRREKTDRVGASEAIRVYEPGFWEILWVWFIAIKKKICPNLIFYREKEVHHV